VTFTLDDIGLASVITPQTLEQGLAYGGGISDVGKLLLGLTRRDLADEPWQFDLQHGRHPVTDERVRQHQSGDGGDPRGPSIMVNGPATPKREENS
jgi:hypothetical protein